MFTHCHRNFKPFETWFLFNNRNFTQRKLHLGVCPICDADIAELVETRIADGKIFRQMFYKKRVEDIMSVLTNQVDYTSYDIKKIKGVPFGLCYGENKEIHNCKGEVIEIRQKRCDYFGTKELILTIQQPYSS